MSDAARLRELLRRAYDAGFAGSAEGFNAEYPFDGDFADDADYRAERDAFVEALVKAGGE